MPKKVIVAMSGGVDSSVVAALLQGQGFEVSGMFMKNWSPEDMQSLSDCPWEQDQADAAAVCAHLGIPFRSINFEKEYREKVVNYFLAEYAAGRTPNPDVMCNKEIKFSAFLKAAEEMGADYIATGHYARVCEVEGQFQLLRGVDPGKDQSYFLYTLNQEQLSKSLFPLGELTKKEVRLLAERYKLPTAAKKDSQGICFIGHIDLKKFLLEHITAKSGATFLLPSGGENRFAQAVEVGRHQGVMFYTIGERAGAVVDNGQYRRLRRNADVPPLYVVGKDIEKNILYVTEKHDDPAFYVQEVKLEQWLGPVASLPQEAELLAQVRYQQKELGQVDRLEVKEEGMGLHFTNPQWALAPGQSVVVYNQEQVLGGGIISSV